MDKEVLQRWLQAGYIDEGTLFETSAGTQQGGIISPVIANMALDGLEAAVYASVGSSKLARSKAQLNVVRYADDFVVTGASRGVLEHKVLPAVDGKLLIQPARKSVKALDRRGGCRGDLRGRDTPEHAFRADQIA